MPRLDEDEIINKIDEFVLGSIEMDEIDDLFEIHCFLNFLDVVIAFGEVKNQKFYPAQWLNDFYFDDHSLVWRSLSFC